VAQSLAVQPRYFQFAYVLICLQVAQRGSQSWVDNAGYEEKTSRVGRIFRLRLRGAASVSDALSRRLYPTDESNPDLIVPSN
jgi:hypothetical protein